MACPSSLHDGINEEHDGFLSRIQASLGKTSFTVMVGNFRWSGVGHLVGDQACDIHSFCTSTINRFRLGITSRSCVHRIDDGLLITVTGSARFMGDDQGTVSAGVADELVSRSEAEKARVLCPILA